MATRPFVEKREVERIIKVIYARHAKHDDPNLERMPDDAGGVCDYLRRYYGPHLPRSVRQADSLDYITLNNYLWWQDRDREEWGLSTAVELGQFLSTVGAQVGVSKQGLNSRRERLAALLKFRRPDETRLREWKRDDAAAERARDAMQRWVWEHREQLHTLVAGLLTEAARYNPERNAPVDGEDEDAYRERWEWLDELAKDARDDAFTPESMTLLSLAAQEVRTSPGVLDLAGSPQPSNVHRVLIRVDQLRSEFAELGKRAAAEQGDAAGSAGAH